MISKYQNSAGFTLLEMLVVIAISAMFMGIVMTIPLNNLRSSDNTDEVAKRFTFWLQQQQTRAIFSSQVLRMCIEERQIIMQQFYNKEWKTMTTSFPIPKSVSVTPSYFDSENVNSLSCFQISVNGIEPIGKITFGPTPVVSVEWPLEPDLPLE